MTSTNDFLCQQMFRHACAFAECADMAEAKVCHDTADIELYTSPATVNSAFSCEVFLKALLKHYNLQIKREHQLKELYDLLPEEIRKWIKLSVTRQPNKDWTDVWGRDELELISDAFREWRYCYEHDWSKSSIMTINYGFLCSFRNALREACCQLLFKKTWEEYTSQQR